MMNPGHGFGKMRDRAQGLLTDVAGNVRQRRVGTRLVARIINSLIAVLLNLRSPHPNSPFEQIELQPTWDRNGGMGLMKYIKAV